MLLLFFCIFTQLIETNWVTAKLFNKQFIGRVVRLCYFKPDRHGTIGHVEFFRLLKM